MNDPLDKLFENLNTSFDVEVPNEGHQKRFLNKLNNQNKEVLKKPSKLRTLWKPLMGIAATAAIILTVLLVNKPSESSYDLAAVSPELAKTESFFTVSIESEMKKIENVTDHDTQALVKDAMIQMSKLEMEYEKLKSDLRKSGDDKRVIYAMISNFQNRINILESTLKQIELVKQLKNNNNESNQTI